MDDVLRREYLSSRDMDGLAAKLGVNRAAVKARACKLGVNGRKTRYGNESPLTQVQRELLGDPYVIDKMWLCARLGTPKGLLADWSIDDSYDQVLDNVLSSIRAWSGGTTEDFVRFWWRCAKRDVRSYWARRANRHDGAEGSDFIYSRFTEPATDSGLKFWDMAIVEQARTLIDMLAEPWASTANEYFGSASQTPKTIAEIASSERVSRSAIELRIKQVNKFLRGGLQVGGY